MYVHLVVQNPSIFLIAQIVRYAKAYVIASDHVHALISAKVWQKLYPHVKGKFAYRVKRVQTQWHYENVLRYMLRHEGEVRCMNSEENVLKKILDKLENLEKRIDKLERSSRQTTQQNKQNTQNNARIEFKSKYATLTMQYNSSKQLVWIELRQGKNKVSTGLTHDEFNALITTLQNAKKSFGIKSGRKIKRVQGFEKALK